MGRTLSTTIDGIFYVATVGIITVEHIISKKSPMGVSLIKKVGPQKEKPTFIL